MIRSATQQWYLLLAALFVVCESSGMTTNSPFDPLPLYTTANPHEFLYTVGRDEIRGLIPEYEQEHANFTITIFGGRATDAIDSHKKFVELGDIHGPWNMLALTFDTCPNTTLLPPALNTAANTAYCSEAESNQTFLYKDTPTITSTQVTLNTGPNFGKVSVPAEFRKVGARFEVALMVLENFGAKLQGGFADVQQTPTSFTDISAKDFNNQSTLPSGCTPDECCIAQNLLTVNQVLTGTDAINIIAEQMELDVATFHKTNIEDIRGQLFWRHAYPMNYDRDGWPRFLFMPFAQLIGTLAISPKINTDQQFGVPLGNNGHDSVGFNFGFTIDFDETMEIGIEAGGTFFSREKISRFRIPVAEQQTGIYPCVTDVCLKPGHNWHFLGTLHARRFIDKLSALAQFALISHNKDRISPMVFDSKIADSLEMVEDLTKWDLRLFNLALNYEISPHISLGVLWQAKLGRRNAPRVNTLLASFVANY